MWHFFLRQKTSLENFRKKKLKSDAWYSKVEDDIFMDNIQLDDGYTLKENGFLPVYE